MPLHPRKVRKNGADRQDWQAFAPDGSRGGRSAAAGRRVAGKGEFLELARDLERQLGLSGAMLLPHFRLDETVLDDCSPDAVILASGGLPITASIPGADLPQAVQAWDQLKASVAVGRPVAVIGGAVGMEMALLLAVKGDPFRRGPEIPARACGGVGRESLRTGNVREQGGYAARTARRSGQEPRQEYPLGDAAGSGALRCQDPPQSQGGAGGRDAPLESAPGGHLGQGVALQAMVSDAVHDGFAAGCETG